jgi:hypothetical protein
MVTAISSVQTVEVDVKYDRTTQSQLAKQAPQLSAELVEVRIQDQESLDDANQLILASEQWLKAVDRIMDPVRDATHKAWKAAIAAQDEFKAPVQKPLAALKAIAAKFIADARAEAELRQLRLEAEQRRQNEIDAKKAAAALRISGATKEEIRQAKEEIKATPALIVAPQVEASAGMALRTYYSVKVDKLETFLQYLLTDRRLLNIFSASEKVKEAIAYELKPEAAQFKERYAIPGTCLVKKATGAWRG